MNYAVFSFKDVSFVPLRWLRPCILALHRLIKPKYQFNFSNIYSRAWGIVADWQLPKRYFCIPNPLDLPRYIGGLLSCWGITRLSKMLQQNL